MRPDTKKKKHHDSVKCEKKAKAKAAEEAKRDEKAQNQKKKQQPAKDEEATLSENPFSLDKPPTTSTSVSFNKSESSEYAKRQVTSNWTKYEIPSSDDESTETEIGTGPDFHYVLENSSDASDHLQLKAEKEWENRVQDFNSEFFALNLNNLETKISCVPLHQLLSISEEDLDEETVRQLNQYAQQSQENYQEKFKDDYEPVEDVSKRLIENLKVRPKADDEPKKLQIQDATSKNNAKAKSEDDDLEDWLEDYLS